MTLEQKFNRLLSEPIRSFNPFGAVLLAECWLLTSGMTDRVSELSEGRQRLLADMADAL